MTTSISTHPTPPTKVTNYCLISNITHTFVLTLPWRWVGRGENYEDGENVEHTFEISFYFNQIQNNNLILSQRK